MDSNHDSALASTSYATCLSIGKHFNCFYKEFIYEVQTLTTFYILPYCVGNPLLGTCAVLCLCCVPSYGSLRNPLLFTSWDFLNQHIHTINQDFVSVASVFHIFRNFMVQLTHWLLRGLNSFLYLIDSNYCIKVQIMYSLFLIFIYYNSQTWRVFNSRLKD